ncbi:substrate-binding periplasmic protein [Pseudoalteromonas sp. SSDWG2]|uniref:substrate-binding periplasmic protein n=1 Tax=Pseudoalteromonas sp. SSDWG2 TaxID=3139391 RepID=UPI003BAD2554
MGFKHLYFFTSLTVLSAPCFAFHDDINHIHGVSEMWANFTHDDGSGLYWEIANRIYEGELLSLEATTYQRAVNQFNKGDVDFILGIYASDIEGDDHSLITAQFIDVDYVAACVKKGAVPARVDTLQYGVGAWVKDYGYEAIFDIKQFYEVPDRAKGLQMLSKGRVDYFIDALTEINLEFDAHPSLIAEVDCKVIHEEGLYIAFHDDERGQRLKKRWDTQFQHLLDSGEIKQMFVKYKVSYPFEMH